jgi:hypothetical protein
MRVTTHLKSIAVLPAAARSMGLECRETVRAAPGDHPSEIRQSNMPARVAGDHDTPNSAAQRWLSPYTFESKPCPRPLGALSLHQDANH